MKSICVIPARGGSKRIPDKNIRDFCGRPMISWSITTARDSGLFDDVIVSTDSDRIAAVAIEYGASVPFRRPPELSHDHCGTLPVIKHTIDWIESQQQTVDEVCCIYATAPFLQVGTLNAARQAVRSGRSVMAFGAASFAAPIQRAFTLDSESRPSMVNPEHFETRSQDLESAYHDAGVFLWGTRDAWVNDVHPFGEHTTAIVIPRQRVHDIDTIDDWQRAELYMRTLDCTNCPVAAG